MRPVLSLHFGSEFFSGSVTACQGVHIAEVIRLVGAMQPELRWYVADVRTTGCKLPFESTSFPLYIGDTDALINMTLCVEQFESGVFAAVPHSVAHPCFRNGGLWTEDDDLADLGDAVVEIRAFDTTYVSVASGDAELLDVIKDAIAAGLRGQ